MTDDTDDSPDDTDDSDDPGPLTRTVRTVTPPYLGRPDAEMDAIGWGYVAVLVVVLFPFLPVLAAVWVVVKLIELLVGDD